MPVSLGPNFTVDEMVNLVQIGAVLPTTATLFSTNNIISLLDNEMRAEIIPLVKTLNEEFWVVNYDQNIVLNQTAYQLPYRAAASALRDIVLVDQNNNEIKLVRYEPEDIKFPMIPYGSPYFPLGYYLKDNAIVFFPGQVAQYTSYTLRMKYERRPNNLTSNQNCGQITAIDVGDSEVTVNFVPSSWTANTTTVDLINNIPPFNSWEDDVSITDINGLVLTLSSIPDDLAVGNWVAQSMTTPIPQIPYEGFPVLTQCGVLKCVSALNDSSAIQRAEKELESKKVNFRSMMTPRVEGTPKILSGSEGVFNWGRNVWGNWGQ